jgi:CelD/BcsL family acetyltransferase involved in cellulose biosynthesis
LDELRAAAPEWNALAEAQRSPFLTVEWLEAWWEAFGHGEPEVVTVGNGDLRAAAFLARDGTRLTAPANDHSGDWDVLAADEDARNAVWDRVAALGAPVLALPAMHEPAAERLAREVLRPRGYRVVAEVGPESPFLELPASYDELLAAKSRNFRSQLGRRRRGLEKEGELVFRTTLGGPSLDEDLDAMLRVEAAGWKSTEGTAILSDARTQSLYRAFAHVAAERGWLRLHLLELDGRAIAADYSLVFAGGEFLLKTGFDEEWGRLSPGLVLRGEVLRRAIEEGLGYYDFLGGPDHYKLRWTEELRPRATLRAFRGARGAGPYLYRSRVRPLLKAARGRLRARSEDAGDTA